MLHFKPLKKIKQFQTKIDKTRDFRCLLFPPKLQVLTFHNDLLWAAFIGTASTPVFLTCGYYQIPHFGMICSYSERSFL